MKHLLLLLLDLIFLRLLVEKKIILLSNLIFYERLPRKSASLELVPPFENQELNERPRRSLEKIRYI